MKALAVLALFCVLALISSPSAFAQWQFNGATVSATTANQPRAVADGSGGVIVAWYENRNGNADIYVQRLDASGYPQWTPNGVALCTAAGDQMYPELVDDGAGGAIVIWQEQPINDGPIYAQRVDASGAPQWATNGVAVCSVSSYQREPAIASDGVGGAMVAWADWSSGWDIYAQRLDASGNLLWASSGVPLCTVIGNQGNIGIASDGFSGAIMAWTDSRNGYTDIYAQHINASGATSWTPDGIGVCTVGGHQSSPQVTSDGLGGSIVTWTDSRAGDFNYGIFVQRLDESGVPLWTGGGVSLSTAQYDLSPEIIRDGAHGAIITWEDGRGGIRSVYAQRVNMSGVPLWTPNGVAVTTQGGFDPELVSDGGSGAIITWRYGDVYAQRLNASGDPVWVAGGVAVCTAANQLYPTIVSDGKSGAIVTWEDHRPGGGGYAQRVESRYGSWGRPEPTITSVADVPDDNGGNVTITWDAGDRDALNLGTITHYLIWRSTAVASASAESLRQPSDEWELVGNQPVLGLPSYSLIVATPDDSTSEGNADYFFQIWSSTADALVFWPSNVMTGYSVDNAAPAAPVSLTAQRVGSDVELTWNSVVDSDLSDYVIYRANASGVTPVPINFVAYSVDTTYVDAAAPASELYYIVIARDVHENEGAPSNEASVGTVTGIGDTPAITALTVLQNHPNPFTGTTDLEIGLASDADVRVEIFDVTGRRVSSIDVSGVKAGWQRIPFSGRDDRGQPLASGVYLYRVRANGQVVTKKMVLAR